ncbi:MAG TPA: DUF2520 domain-containing protein [Acidimicrobiia bacterium]|nr:DUF2520 domain-containing protein [Acidimicrobiia bacterium]
MQLDDPNAARTFALVGPGRAGGAVARALIAAGWHASAVAGREMSAGSTRRMAADLSAEACPSAEVGLGADLIVIATPDAAIAEASELAVEALPPGSLLVHLSGSRGLSELAAAAERRPDVRYGALHPLVTIAAPDADLPADGWCAVAGDPDVYRLAATLGLQAFAIADDQRGRYHATAAVAANHLVALMGQVDRLARSVGVPFEAFAPVARAALDNCFDRGPREALTGPVERGDHATVERHLRDVPERELVAYRALAAAALDLCGHDDPELAARLR